MAGTRLTNPGDAMRATLPQPPQTEPSTIMFAPERDDDEMSEAKGRETSEGSTLNNIPKHRVDGIFSVPNRGCIESDPSCFNVGDVPRNLEPFNVNLTSVLARSAPTFY
ncbi:hypothetical protein M407DRAFT_19651 [Tulasnella calospora MUT 4182]|uniref:Uncharacterized protein n=1 Tax=Tulasnella calospora MUT 4182 TaxID=1051891 RepID=A0A0C3MBZ6_9AGAM|nr:hypothetical protein M407DRAFT_19651 [Tulasnella calospora MUT 4182]